MTEPDDEQAEEVTIDLDTTGFSDAIRNLPPIDPDNLARIAKGAGQSLHGYSIGLDTRNLLQRGGHVPSHHALTVNGVDVSDQVTAVTLPTPEPTRLTPADCPHHPTSPEGKAWIRANCLRPDAADVRAADDRIDALGLGKPRWGLLGAHREAPDPATEEYLDHIAPERLERRPHGITSAWFDEAQHWNLPQNGGPPPALAGLQQAIDALGQAFQASITSISQVFKDAFSGLGSLQGLDLDEPEVHTIRGMPAGRVRTCHHGNTRGQCRPCSQHRR